MLYIISKHKNKDGLTDDILLKLINYADVHASNIKYKL